MERFLSHFQTVTEWVIKNSISKSISINLQPDFNHFGLTWRWFKTSFFFSFLHLDTVLSDSTPEYFDNIWQIV